MTIRVAHSGAYLAGFTAAFLFGLNGTVLKVVMAAGFSAASVTFIRALTTMTVAGIILFVTNKSAFKLTKKQFLLSLVVGLVGVAAVQWLFASAIQLIPVGITLLIEYISVVFVALFARFVYRESILPRIWVAIVFVVIGLAIVAEIWATKLNGIGVLFALLSSGCYATYFLAGEKALKVMSSITMTFWSMLWTALFWGLFGGIAAIDWSLFGKVIPLSGNMANIHLPVWSLLAWATVLGSFVTTALSYFAINRLKATPAGIIASSEVVVAFIVAWLWLSEQLSLAQILGACLVVIGIVVAQTARESHVADLDYAASSSKQ